MRAITKEEIKKIVEKYLDAMDLEFQRNPFNFRSERDMQAFLYNNFLKEIPDEYPTNINSGGKNVKIRLFHQEYGIGGNERLDFGIITPEQIKKMDQIEDIKGAKTSKRINLNPFIGFEFKSDTTPISKLIHKIQNDCKKLVKSNADHQFFICYYKDLVRSNKDNHLNYFVELKTLINDLNERYPKIQFKFLIYYHLTGGFEEISR